MADNQHAIFSFQVTVLSSFLALKYRGDDIVSLFQSHPETMWVALVSLLCYCISYQFEPRFGQVGRGGMGLFGSILSISLASLLFDDGVSFVVYSLWALLSNCEIMWPVIQVLWSWVYQTSEDGSPPFSSNTLEMVGVRN
ncbi:hypothetical protein RHSIM_Rhsim05G0025800 [Rhododendron simsii]|uniref:Uncharacterized protein n=1 Tax=Rhododendron simsii TaxID=118357 RepID=A0A834GZM9_RHOSS|nr:hypothetical protein RHSIM_Rhsim05G0025800 [Rhododendron simsii]